MPASWYFPALLLMGTYPNTLHHLRMTSCASLGNRKVNIPAKVLASGVTCAGLEGYLI